MKEITAVKINPTDFAPFGTYCSMTEPEGYPLQGEIHKFYPDRISVPVWEVWDFLPLPYAKMSESLRWQNTTQPPGKAL